MQTALLTLSKRKGSVWALRVYLGFSLVLVWVSSDYFRYTTKYIDSGTKEVLKQLDDKPKKNRE